MLLDHHRRPHSPATLRAMLDRTLRLMRDDLRPEVSDAVLLEALLAARVRIVADAANLASPAGQTALITTILLLLRTGSSIVLDAPDVALLGPQPPLMGTMLHAALADIGADLAEGTSLTFMTTVPATSGAADVLASTEAQCPPIVIVLGDAPYVLSDAAMELVVRLSGTAWTADLECPRPRVAGRMDGTACASGIVGTGPTRDAATSYRWVENLRWPLGALAAAGLAATEVYKWSMRRLSAHALSPAVFEQLFRPVTVAHVSLLPGAGVELPPDLLTRLEQLNGLDVGDVDAISGGAITQAALYALARVPNITGHVRVIEPEMADATNLNRYALLRRSALDIEKATALASLTLGGLTIEPHVMRFERNTPPRLGGLAPAVLVGVDHIPTRWEAQRAFPTWLGIGATSHYFATSSAHVRGQACAWCAHPTDSPDVGPIPTVAFVSHWAGLLVASRLILHRLGVFMSMANQSEFVAPLRLDQPAAFWRSPVAPRPGCPFHCAPRRVAA